MGRDDSDFVEYSAARWRSLVRSAICLGCQPTEAEDLAQTTLLKCYVSWRKVIRADDQDAYVYRILVNTMRDARRRPWRRETPSEAMPEVPLADHTAAVHVVDALHRASTGLSESHRQVVVLRYLAGLTEQQTASVLGIAVGTVKSRSARALDQLARDTNLSDLPGGA